MIADHHIRLLWFVEQLAPSSGKTTNETDWPSWVPRYDSYPGVKVVSKEWGVENLWRAFRADNALLIEPHLRRDTYDELKIQGLIVDEVDEVLGSLAELDVKDERIKLCQWWIFVLESDSVETTPLLPEAFAATLTCGINFDGIRYFDDLTFIRRFHVFMWVCKNKVKEEVEIERYWGLLAAGYSDPENPLPTDKETTIKLTTEFHMTMWSNSRNRSFFLTKSGRIGMGPAKMQKGDKVCILFGNRAPTILRKDGDHWKLIGMAYVHGIMEGEYVWDLQQSQRLEEETQFLKFR